MTRREDSDVLPWVRQKWISNDVLGAVKANKGKEKYGRDVNLLWDWQDLGQKNATHWMKTPSAQSDSIFLKRLRKIYRFVMYSFALPNNIKTDMHDEFVNWLRGFIPPPGTVNRFERMRGGAGALFGLMLAGLLSHLTLGQSLGAAWLIAPMGASAVLLFAVPASPLAQPWSIIGGNISAALIGVTCQMLVQDTLIAAALAVSLAIGAMFTLRCLHPPSGAVALTAVLGGPAIHAMGYSFVLVPVALNSFLLLAAALFFNNATGRRYPHVVQPARVNQHETADAVPSARLGFGADDLDAVLRSYNQVLDISRDDLQTILAQTEMRGYQRRFGSLTCESIMSRDIITVEFGTHLDVAWNLMRQHRLTALPVIDRARRVIGIITKTDFMEHAGLDRHVDFGSKLASLLRRTRLTHTDKPEVVGQIMCSDVITAATDKPVVELVTLMSDAGLHQLPIVDHERKLAGMLTQSDMIAALYETSLHKTAPAYLETA